MMSLGRMSLVLLLGGCAFEVPKDGARETCRAFVATMAEKHTSCGSPAVAVEDGRQRGLARCEGVIAINPLGPSLAECQAGYMSLPCEQINEGKAFWCPSFLQVSP